MKEDWETPVAPLPSYPSNLHFSPLIFLAMRMPWFGGNECIGDLVARKWVGIPDFRNSKESWPLTLSGKHICFLICTMGILIYFCEGYRQGQRAGVGVALGKYDRLLLLMGGLASPSSALAPETGASLSNKTVDCQADCLQGLWRHYRVVSSSDTCQDKFCSGSLSGWRVLLWNVLLVKWLTYLIFDLA